MSKDRAALIQAIRLRRLLAEDRPQIVGYDGDEFARRLYYAQRPVQPSLDAIRGARETSASILERLADGDWARAGTHTEIGPYSVDTWLEIYSMHCHDHADQIERALPAARSAVGDAGAEDAEFLGVERAKQDQSAEVDDRGQRHHEQ